MLVRLEGEFATQGCGRVMRQGPARRDAPRSALLKQYAPLDGFLLEHARAGPWRFDAFGGAETVFTPLFMRLGFLEYCEDFGLPDVPAYARVRQGVDACVAHPAAQQVTRQEVVKLHHDDAKGAGNGALLPGRRQSPFALEPGWRGRPMPPKGKYGRSASDAEPGR